MLEIGPGPRRVNGEAPEKPDEMSSLSLHCHIQRIEHSLCSTLVKEW